MITTLPAILWYNKEYYPLCIILLLKYIYILIMINVLHAILHTHLDPMEGWISNNNNNNIASITSNRVRAGIAGYHFVF